MTYREKIGCSRCRTRETRSATGLCAICRADQVPTVHRGADGLIRVAGDLVLTTHAAVALAHKLADAVTP
jgi:hypothetical protein